MVPAVTILDLSELGSRKAQRFVLHSVTTTATTTNTTTVQTVVVVLVVVVVVVVVVLVVEVDRLSHSLVKK